MQTKKEQKALKNMGGGIIEKETFLRREKTWKKKKLKDGLKER